jgi:Tfp pilus assembly protein PilF
LFEALGEGYLRAEAYGDAEAAFQTAIAKAPKDAGARAALGDAYFHEKKLDAAEKEIKAAIALDPGRAEFHVALSEVYGEGNRDEKAAEECVAALERGVNRTLEATLKYNLACFNARLHRERECLYWLRQALEAGFNDIDFMRKDPDLASVRDLPAFRELFQK